VNGWLSVHGISKHVPPISGGTILLGSSRAGENKQDRYMRRVYEERGGKE